MSYLRLDCNSLRTTPVQKGIDNRNLLYNLLKPFNHRVIPLSIICLLTLFTSCDSSKTYSGTKEGKIIYDVTFPFEEPSLMLDLYPKEMTLYFKGDLMHTELKSSYDLLSTAMIVDNDSKHFTQMLKNMSSRHVVELDEDETKDWLKQYPSLRLEKTGENIELAGHTCEKILAHFPDGKTPPIELYCTSELDLSNDNWWNQFSAIHGFLLGYDVEMYGKRMRIRAREINYEEISDAKFRIPVNYEKVTAQAMSQHLTDVVNEFIKP